MAKVRAHSKDGVTKATVDGVDISGALSLTFEHVGGEYPEMTVKFLVDELELDAEANAKMNGCTAGNDTAVRFIDRLRFDR